MVSRWTERSNLTLRIGYCNLDSFYQIYVCVYIYIYHHAVVFHLANDRTSAFIRAIARWIVNYNRCVSRPLVTRHSVSLIRFYILSNIVLNTRSTVKVAISCHLVRSQNENVNNTLAGQPTVYNGVTILTPNKLSVVTEENYSVSLRPFNQFPSKSFSSPITSIYNNNLDRIEISTSPIFSLREVKKKKKSRSFNGDYTTKGG